MTPSARNYQSVMITGGAGFLGSALVEYLLLDQHFRGRIIVVDALTYAGSIRHLEPFLALSALTFVRGDVRNRELMESLLRDHDIELVLHFAAETHVDRSIDSPIPFAEANVLGTAALVHAVCKVQSHQRPVHLHCVSTDEVFGECPAGSTLNESAPYAPSSPYAASKAAADHWVRAAGRTFGLQYTISHSSNCLGPRQHPEKFVPLFALRAAAGLPLPLYGDGQQERDWLASNDHARAVWAIATRGQTGRSYGIGARQVRTNRAMAEAICDLVASQLGQQSEAVRALIELRPDRPGHDRRYALDPSRLENELGWSPSRSIDVALRDTVAWYLAEAAGIDNERGAAILASRADGAPHWMIRGD